MTQMWMCILVWFGYFGLVSTTCTYPWGGGFWGDSLGRTAITFSTNTMQGYDLSYRGSDVTTWTCLIKDGDLVLSRSSSINVAGDDYYLYVCMLVNTVSSNKFYYHLMTSVDSNIVKTGTSTEVRSTARLTIDSVSDICTICAQNPTSISLQVTEYTVMGANGTATTLGSSPAFASNPCDPTTTTASTSTTTTTTSTTTTTTTTTTSTTTSGVPQDTSSQPQETSTNKTSMTGTSTTNVAAIVGGIMGSLVAVVGIVGVIWLVKKKRFCFKSGS
ncbi:uncharacterized protein [Argopecten irradians]|uniref:uncharacterized protein n=1 Tax=Argopecten irradians TaxID=31199 RepID=UPI0037172E28